MLKKDQTRFFLHFASASPPMTQQNHKKVKNVKKNKNQSQAAILITQSIKRMKKERAQESAAMKEGKGR